jgi:hypothetical protein
MVAAMDDAEKIAADITDCGPDGGCEECDVCRYLNFLEWAGAVGKPDSSTIQRNDAIEAHLRKAYPHVERWP